MFLLAAKVLIMQSLTFRTYVCYKSKINGWRKLLNCKTFSTEVKANQNVQSKKLRSFRQLISKVDPSSSTFLENVEFSKGLEDKYRTIVNAVYAGGGEKATVRHTQQHKKLLARERIKRLLDDDGDFLELAPFAGMGMEYGDIPAAGLVAGIGRVHGHRCLVAANDATVKGGTLFPISVKKQLRVQEIAQENRLPCIYLVDSGGAFLPLQFEIFQPGGRAFYNEAIMSSLNIPQVAIVCGSCTAGGAYLPTMADEAVIVHRIGTIFLGGPPLVQAATGEIVSAEDLGGATLHSSVSGCTDYFASTEEEAFEMGRDIVAALNMPEPITPSDYEAPLYNSERLQGIVSPEAADLDPFEVIAHITDGSRFHEFKAMFGQQLVCGFSRIHGYLVGLIANNGTLTDDAAVKGSHFVQLCSQRNIPITFLQNAPKEIPVAATVNEGIANGATLRGHGKMMAAVACSPVPKITIIMGGSYGTVNYAMAGRSFQPNFLFTWPSAQTSMLPPDQLVSEIMQSQYLEPTEQTEQSDLKNDLSTKIMKNSSSFYSSSRLWDDGIVLPQDTRKVLGQCLEIVNQPGLSTDAKTPFLKM